MAEKTGVVPGMVNPLVGIELGSAGCISTTKCGHLTKDLTGFYCVKYRKQLEPHPKIDAPWRLDECSDDAHKDSWAKAMRDRK